MSTLTHIDKQKLERELGMGGGYVLDFSNRTFEEFFWEVVGVQIYDSQYDYGSGSKANRMRAFWRVATDKQLILLFQGLLEGWEIYSNAPIPDTSRDLIHSVLAKLGVTLSTLHKQQDDTFQLNIGVSQRLTSRLFEVTALPAQRRGYEFEKFLQELFDVYDLSARASFRLIGEQIDGSFVVHNDTYLLEAKWQNSPIGVADLHTFEGKLGEKASWSRGLFVSNSGFSTDGLQAFGRGKRTICMDGFDISEMLRQRMSFVKVIDAKVRRAAETGCPYVSVHDLFV
ncbi:restriction endonuclease [Prosthecochloris sp.]|uniref:restriction endonuclease n=1 Tax=Prosthecochloris sp. TaxID=290513 RepID=UPI00257A749D|nr:restriction endonuclease [Prosthecochloris sp.]